MTSESEDEKEGRETRARRKEKSRRRRARKGSKGVLRAFPSGPHRRSRSHLGTFTKRYHATQCCGVESDRGIRYIEIISVSCDGSEDLSCFKPVQQVST